MISLRFFKKRGVFWLGSAAVLVLSLVAARAFRSTPAPFVTLTARDAIETVLASGKVVGEKSVPLSFIRPGRIAGEFIRDGEAVPAGQVLLRQDGRHEEQAVAQARVSLEEAQLRKKKLLTTDLPDAAEKVRQARANVAYTADLFKRQTELYEQGAITLLLLEQGRRDKELAASALAAAENQLRSLREVQSDQADLDIARAENDLKKAGIDLQDTFLKAPAAGRIVSLDAHRGEFVQAGQRIVTFIPDTPQTHVEIQVDEANAGRIAPGQKAAVSSIAFPGRAFEGKVERLGAIVDAQRGSFSVRLVLDRFEPDLLPESSVSVQIELGRTTGALLLEQRFIVRENGQAAVFVPDDRRAKRIPLKVRDLGNGLFECLEGIQSGQRVLLPQGMREGLRIRPVPLAE